MSTTYRPALLLSALLMLTGTANCADEDNDDESRTADTSSHTNAIETPPPLGVVILAPDRQQRAGLAFQTLEPASLQPEFMAHGKVLDIQALIELRARYRTAQADAEVSGTALQLAQKNRDRIRTLHSADILAGRELVHAEAQSLTEQTRRQAALRQVEDIRRECRQAWGPVLTQLVLDGLDPQFDKLTEHRSFLIRVTLPPGLNLDEPLPEPHVSRDSDRRTALRARFLSTAPQTDELVQGETWFALAETGQLRAGMRINAWIAGGEARPGTWLPTDAIIWYAGKPWAYRKIADDRFVRLPVAARQINPQGWFIDSAGIEAGYQIVTTGVQTLLSEEFRGHIPDEDDD